MPEPAKLSPRHINIDDGGKSDAMHALCDCARSWFLRREIWSMVRDEKSQRPKFVMGVYRHYDSYG